MFDGFKPLFNMNIEALSQIQTDSKIKSAVFLKLVLSDYSAVLLRNLPLFCTQILIVVLF